MIKIIKKLGNIVILQVNIEAQYIVFVILKFNVPNEIPLVFHNDSNYGYYFILKELANKFEGQFECFGKNTENCKTFFALIEKEVANIDKDGNESFVTISYRIKSINSARFMASPLSNLVNNLSERIHKIKCKYEHDDKKCESWGITYEVCDWFLEYTNFKDDLIKYKCLCCNKNYQQKFDGMKS